MSTQKPSRQKPAHSCMMAFIVGTALTGLGPSARGAGGTTPISQEVVTDVNRYCATCWRQAHLPVDAWPDCTQEVLCRLLQRLEPVAWQRVFQNDSPEKDELLRAIDTVKKRQQRTRKYAPDTLLAVASDLREQQRQHRAEERQWVEQQATELLTPRQQQIVQLTLDGWSVQEIAGQLKVPAARISDDKYKAIQQLRKVLV